MLELQTRMEAEVEAYWMPGSYAVAVTDLQTMETIGVNGERLQLSACIMNYFVLLQAALDLQAGRYDASAVDELMSATTWSSNAATARELFAVAGDGDVVAGVARVGELLNELGLERSLIDHPPGYGWESLGIDPNNWTTAVEVNRALALLWRGGLLEEPGRSDLLAKLEAVKPGLNYLTAVAPGRVSHKNGFFPGDTGYVDNDAGIVRFEIDGTEYAFAITFLSEEVPEKYGDITLGQRLTWIAWEFFTERYQ